MIDPSEQWIVCKSPYFIHTIRYPLESITDIFMCIGWGSGKILYPSKAVSGNAVAHMLITPHHVPPGSARSATLSHPATRNASTFIILRLHKVVGFVSYRATAVITLCVANRPQGLLLLLSSFGWRSELLNLQFTTFVFVTVIWYISIVYCNI